jgi:hypothetical protein
MRNAATHHVAAAAFHGVVRRAHVGIAIFRGPERQEPKMTITPGVGHRRLRARADLGVFLLGMLTRGAGSDRAT